MSQHEARVFVREDNSSPLISITAPGKPDIPDSVLEKWQELTNIVARILKVPAGLIMKLHEGQIEVFLRSDTPNNPYKQGERADLGLGLYCETVVGTQRQLLVPDASKDKVWEDNPDIDLGMVSYLGLPIRWPDQEIFGTICALDNKANSYTADFISLLAVLKQLLETDLALLLAYEGAVGDSRTDSLTRLPNRRSLDETLKREFLRRERYDNELAVIMFDIDKFKHVNDHFGHDMGDKVLRALSEATSSGVRDVDILGRWGGEEFLVICPNTNLKGAEANAERLRQIVENTPFEGVGKITCSFGVSIAKSDDNDCNQAVNRADEAMYAAKTAGRNRVRSAV